MLVNIAFSAIAFSTGSPSTAVTNTGSTALMVDWNQDGIKDAYIQGANGATVVTAMYFSPGTGNWPSTAATWVGAIGVTSGGAVTFDFNLDNKPDIATVGCTTVPSTTTCTAASFQIYLGTGSTSLPTATTLPSCTGSCFVQATDALVSLSNPCGGSNMVAGDFDRNNFPDLLICGVPQGISQTATCVMVMNGNSTVAGGSVSGINVIRTNIGITAFSDSNIAVADFNNDGLPDVAVQGTTSTTRFTTVYRNTGSFTGSFFTTTGITQTAITSQIDGGIAFADIDSDGLMDLVVGGATSAAAQYVAYRQTPANTFTTGVSFGASTSAGSVAVADVNSDGFMDIITAGGVIGTSVSANYHLANNGAFGIGAANALGGSVNNGVSIGVSDQNRDGFADFVVLGSSVAAGNTASSSTQNSAYTLSTPTLATISAPTNLGVSINTAFSTNPANKGGGITLTWNKPSTLPNAYTFNAYIQQGTTLIVSPNTVGIITSNTTQQYTAFPGYGNAFNNANFIANTGLTCTTNYRTSCSGGSTTTRPSGTDVQKDYDSNVAFCSQQVFPITFGVQGIFSDYRATPFVYGSLQSPCTCVTDVCCPPGIKFQFRNNVPICAGSTLESFLF